MEEDVEEDYMQARALLTGTGTKNPSFNVDTQKQPSQKSFEHKMDGSAAQVATAVWKRTAKPSAKEEPPPSLPAKTNAVKEETLHGASLVPKW